MATIYPARVRDFPVIAKIFAPSASRSAANRFITRKNYALSAAKLDAQQAMLSPPLALWKKDTTKELIVLAVLIDPKVIDLNPLSMIL